MQKTPQQLAAEFEALILEFDQATRGLFKPREDCARDERQSAKIIRFIDYRVLH